MALTEAVLFGYDFVVWSIGSSRNGEQTRQCRTRTTTLTLDSLLSTKQD